MIKGGCFGIKLINACIFFGFILTVHALGMDLISVVMQTDTYSVVLHVH